MWKSNKSFEFALNSLYICVLQERIANNNHLKVSVYEN